MTIIARCPDCGRYRSLNTEICVCGEDLKTARRLNGVRYYAKIMVNGVRKRFPLGNRIGKARDQHARLVAEYADTGYIKSRLTMTVGEYYKKYFLPEQKRKNKSWDKAKSRYENHLAPVFGHRRLMNIRGHHIQSYINDRLQQKNFRDSLPQPSTVNRELAVLKRLFNQARGDELYSGDNPVYGKTAGPEKKNFGTTLSRAQAADRSARRDSAPAARCA